jgi:hypothetical protein
MKNPITKKGTELPLISLKGKPYLQVAHRILWAREDMPDIGIETEIVTHDKERSICRATIKDATGRILAQATKSEDKQGFGDHLEKAETGAIGRALALVGFGTQFALELDEGDRIVDAPVNKVKFGASGIISVPQGKPSTTPTPQKKTDELASYRWKFGAFKETRLGDGDPVKMYDYCKWLVKESEKNGKPLTGDVKEGVDMCREYLQALKKG